MDRGGLLELCSCRYEGINLQRYLNIPPRFLGADLDNYRAVSPSQKRALEACLYYVHSFEPQEGKGLTLVGPPQMGKTHLAVAVLKGVYKLKKVRGFFFDTKDLFYRLQSYAGSNRYHKLMNLLLNIPLLVLDDLGSERLSDWRVETLSHIISHRYNFFKSTLITTNYNLLKQEEEVARALEERLSPAIVGKIYQMNELIYLTD
ncbi:MAG: ATP-binding protein [Aquificaceae bacterium]|nr:ATP-binding protein [Aquificaceae bacterium]MCX8164336.1 ATP-binding protein [Aquificaceae bacterium]